ncbi:DNA cytosine methyltransferase [Gordonia sp. NPDC003424]
MREGVGELLPQLNEKPVIVDLFAGPGGFDVAAHWLGVQSIGVEFDPAAVATRRAAGLATIHADVRDWSPTMFPAANVLVAGPPCQTFTVAGKGHGRRTLDTVLALVRKLGTGQLEDVEEELAAFEDPRTRLVLEPLIWVLRADQAGQPFEAVVLEQVRTVEPVWRAVQGVLEEHGYGVDVGVLWSEMYGVPQTRRRAILVARRGLDSQDVLLPKPTHRGYVRTAAGEPARFKKGTSGLPWEGMGRALGIEQPFSVISNYGNGGDPANRGRRGHDRPAFTVTGKVFRNRMVFEDGAERRFTPCEAGRLQTFPIDFPWRAADKGLQIGNAVPPRMGAHVLAAALGLEISEKLFERKLAQWRMPDHVEVQRMQESALRAKTSQSLNPGTDTSRLSVA